jgi:hypothetical protein
MIGSLGYAALCTRRYGFNADDIAERVRALIGR